MKPELKATKISKVAILRYQDLAVIFLAGLLIGLCVAWMIEPYLVQLGEALPKPLST